MKISIKTSKELPSEIFLVSDGSLFIRENKFFDGAIIESVTFDSDEIPATVNVVTEEPNICKLSYRSKDGKTFSKNPIN